MKSVKVLHVLKNGPHFCLYRVGTVLACSTRQLSAARIKPLVLYALDLCLQPYTTASTSPVTDSRRLLLTDVYYRRGAGALGASSACEGELLVPIRATKPGSAASGGRRWTSGLTLVPKATGGVPPAGTGAIATLLSNPTPRPTRAESGAEAGRASWAGRWVEWWFGGGCPRAVGNPRGGRRPRGWLKGWLAEAWLARLGEVGNGEVGGEAVCERAADLGLVGSERTCKGAIGGSKRTWARVRGEG